MSAVLASVCLCTASEAATWALDREGSSLGVVGTQTEQAFEGRFTDFDATIVLDPEALQDASIRVVVKTGSFESGAGDRDSSAKEADWFGIEAFPEATFVSDEVTHVDGNSYIASGTLTIKGVERPIELPFTLNVEGQHAVAEGTIDFNRLDYDVGTGEWSDGVFVDFNVTVKLHVEADQAG